MKDTLILFKDKAVFEAAAAELSDWGATYIVMPRAMIIRVLMADLSAVKNFFKARNLRIDSVEFGTIGEED